MAGRPKLEFSEEQVEQLKALARCHCPDSEIAAFLGCGENTIKRHFGPLLKEQREAGKANLRSWQYRLAQKGNATMQIWLGKQILDQRDKKDIEDLHFKDKHEAIQKLEEALAKLKAEVKS